MNKSFKDNKTIGKTDTFVKICDDISGFIISIFIDKKAQICFKFNSKLSQKKSMAAAVCNQKSEETMP